MTGGPPVFPGGGLDVPGLSSSAIVNVGAVGPLSAFGLFTWLIPGFFLGVPGLLIVVIVVAQAIGGAAFIPITRRALGGFGIRRSRPNGRDRD